MHVGERILDVHRHELAPQLVRRRVDRDREAELLRALAERDDAGKHADGRDGDVPRADPEPLRAVEDRERRVDGAASSSCGSPIPMKTTFVTAIGGSSSAISRTCAAISHAARLRWKPMRPVAQKAHWSAQPACDEMQSVSRPPSGMATVSISCPSGRRKRNFSVPSDEVCRATISRRGIVNRSARAVRKRGGKRRHRRESRPLAAPTDAARPALRDTRARRSRPRTREVARARPRV